MPFAKRCTKLKPPGPEKPNLAVFTKNPVDKIAALAKAANVQCESYWPSLYAKLSEKINIKDLITSVGAGGGCRAAASVAVSAPTGGGAKAAEALAAEEEKEEKDERDEDIRGMFDILFSCFCC
ncbi:60S acidic ribosomal protein P1-like [Papaver somniferum]|uniref:60S acidic ribosomal protein P1-like n=1 Tax=Papaver somniferum TaxID=3469 RepID=UPI000E703800|nr:60S acidic ribosomal protein P1-like [Papaver somniferum]